MAGYGHSTMGEPRTVPTLQWNRKYRYFESANGWEYRIVEYEGIIGEATLEQLLSRLSW
jgi:hypothetical protein